MDLLSAQPAMGCGAGKATQYKSTEDADVEPLPLSHSWDSATISKTSGSKRRPARQNRCESRRVCRSKSSKVQISFNFESSS